MHWAYGLGLLFWFKLPNVLLNGGVQGLEQQGLYTFFFITLIIHFIAFLAFTQGLLFFRKRQPEKRYYRFIFLWLGCSAAYFACSFFVTGFDVSYTPVWASHLIFYIPVKILFLYTLWQVVHDPREGFIIPRLGVFFLSLAGVLTTIVSFLYIFVQLASYKRDFWLYSSITSVEISAVQMGNAVIFFVGLYLFARAYLRSAREKPHFVG